MERKTPDELTREDIEKIADLPDLGKVETDPEDLRELLNEIKEKVDRRHYVAHFVVHIVASVFIAVSALCYTAASEKFRAYRQEHPTAAQSMKPREAPVKPAPTK